MTLKKQVEQILSKYPETRNSDIKLTLFIWREFYPTYLKMIDGRAYVKCSDLFNLPREDNVKRIRAKFNADNLYMPTDLDVIKQRGIKENLWRAELGYRPK